MSKIHLLDPSVSELIAAGEVIERPASIVKELLENSIDAGATAITVEIQNGGITFLRITDNGIGFEAEDVPTAFLRHATSKVKEQEDLEQIATLGFRGEALASIAAVSKVELVSKTAPAEMGMRFVLHGGTQVSLEEIGCPVGTTFVVRDLFYNIPARLKFLKKDRVEGSAVQSIMEKLALSHPEISFKLIKDRKAVLHSPGGGSLLQAIHAILGKEFADSLLELDYEYQGVRITGYVTKPAKCRSKRTMQHFFVNDRYVNSRTCLVALDEAYKNSIMVGKFPGCVLKLELPCNHVDVNVHPAKIEVRFVQEKPVFEGVYFAVKTALSKADILTTDVNAEKTFVSRTILPVVSKAEEQLEMKAAPLESKRPVIQEHPPAPRPASGTFAPKSTLSMPKAPAFTAPTLRSPEPVLKDLSSPSVSPEIPAPKEEQIDHFQFLDETSFVKKESAVQTPAAPIQTMPEEAPEEPAAPIQIKMIGELFKTYILFEVDDVFVMMDKHAAHERILFERLKRNIDLHESQVLLVPQELRFSIEEQQLLQEQADAFASFGFRFSFEREQVQVLEAPLVLHRYPLEEIIEDLAEGMLRGKVELTPSRLENLLHSMACRAAIKANEDHSIEELQALAEQVYLDARIRHCPHGRPVGITMTKYEVEKKFGRHE